jgi:FMN phosphatase YigB (HAD superfamily)
MTTNNNIIITDCDGVLLNWEYAFNEWMEFNGYPPVEGHKQHYNIQLQYDLPSKNFGHKLIRDFNASAAIGFLPPHRDAQYYVKLLHEKHQYKFVVLTSLSKDPYAQKLRERNLTKLFGDAFLEVICLGTGDRKDQALVDLYQKYGRRFWIEDHPENADAGARAGFKTLLMEHKHNLDYAGLATVVADWEQIYNVVTTGVAKPKAATVGSICR